MQPAARFLLMARAALADGKIGFDEKGLLIRAAPRLGVSKEEAHTLLEEIARGGKLQIAPPADPGERQAVVADIVRVVWADGKVTPKEEAFVTRLAASMGVDAETALRLLVDRPKQEAGPVTAVAAPSPAEVRRGKGPGSEPPRAPRAVGLRPLGAALHLSTVSAALVTIAMIGVALVVVGAWLSWQPGSQREPRTILIVGALLTTPMPFVWVSFARVIRHGTATVAEVTDVTTRRWRSGRRGHRHTHTETRVTFAYVHRDIRRTASYRVSRSQAAAGDRLWIIVDPSDPRFVVPWEMI